MKHLKYIFTTFAVVILAASCSQDELPGDGGDTADLHLHRVARHRDGGRCQDALGRNGRGKTESLLHAGIR